MFYMLLSMCTYNIYKVSVSPGSVQQIMPSSSLRYNGSLATRTVVCLTAAKIKPLLFSVSGFTLSNIADICIFMILYDFYLLPA
jgi:hypothetical protein